MLPGMGKAMKDIEVDDKQFTRIEAMILSMTPDERDNPDLLNGSRRKRIATGCGMSVQDLNQFLKQFEMMQKMFSGMGKGKGGLMGGLKKMMGGLGGGGGANPLAGMDLPDMPDMSGAAGASGADALFGGGPQTADDKKKAKAERKALKAKRKRGRK